MALCFIALDHKTCGGTHDAKCAYHKQHWPRHMFPLCAQLSSSEAADAAGLLRAQRGAPLGMVRSLPLPRSALAVAAASGTGADAVAAAAAVSQEQPCMVQVVLWPFSTSDAARPLAGVGSPAPLLVIPRAVLCSEMGVCVSPCGRMLAVCVAPDGGVPSPKCEAWLKRRAAVELAGPLSTPDQRFGQEAGRQDLLGSVPDEVRPASNALPPQQSKLYGFLQYELRLYSLDGPTFGHMLAARPLTAAQNLTSVQVSLQALNLLYILPFLLLFHTYLASK
jgi:hypothetical protein